MTAEALTNIHQKDAEAGITDVVHNTSWLGVTARVTARVTSVQHASWPAVSLQQYIGDVSDVGDDVTLLRPLRLASKQSLRSAGWSAYELVQ